VTHRPNTLLLADAGPLITLAYAEALSLLFKPGWQINLVDMVLHEVTRSETPTSQTIKSWASQHQLEIIPTKTFEHYKQALSAGAQPRKSNLGELAIQETMNNLAINSPDSTGVFLFEDHKIARASFLLPDNCRKVSTRAFLLFLERQEWIKSAAEIERKAVINGRQFSELRFPA
jgi:hypothetical protein